MLKDRFVNVILKLMCYYHIQILWDTLYLAGGCLWGVQHFFDSVPGVVTTEAGRANGKTDSLDGPYDGYAECAEEHQHHLKRHPEDCSYCHIPDEIMNKYRTK